MKSAKYNQYQQHRVNVSAKGQQRMRTGEYMNNCISSLIYVSCPVFVSLHTVHSANADEYRGLMMLGRPAN